MSAHKNDPTSIIHEILGEPASLMRNPVNADYLCPFISGKCIKRSHRFADPYPVCTINWGQGNAKRPICVCPKRFFEASLTSDIVKHAWPVEKSPKNPRLVREVQMKGFGMVDFVIADFDEKNSDVLDFVSVELQAVDLTGSVEPAYQAIINSQQLDRRHSYGINWANVRKRYINQLIIKGYYHHQWKSKIISIIQEPLYDYFKKTLNFSELDVNSSDANIMFMLYDYVDAPEKGPLSKKLTFKKCIGTSHSSLMMQVLYQQTPDKKEFINKIKERM